VRQFDQRVAAELRGRAGVRRASLHFHHAERGTAGAEQQPVVHGGGRRLGRLTGQHHIMLVRQFGNDFAGADRADFFIGIERHRQFCVIAPAGVVQDFQRMQDHRKAALVVGDSGSIDVVAVDAPRLRREDALLIHGVHMADQHQLFTAGAREGADHHVGTGAAAGLAPLRLRAQRLQPRLGEIGHLLEALDVAAAGFNQHHLVQRLD